MGISEIGGIILDKIEFIYGLIAGLIYSIYAWHQRQVELKSKLYYPLFIACYNLLIIFDEIKTIKNDEGKELYKGAAKHLDDIMNSYGTITNLKSNFFLSLLSKETGKDYVNMFFKVKRTVDLNSNSIDKNWSTVTIWFDNARVKTYTGDDPYTLRKIDEFSGLYFKLSVLKEFCEGKDKTLRGIKKI